MIRPGAVSWVLCCCVPAITLVICYFLWQRYYIREIACVANFVQHHQDETLDLWLNYKLSGDSGILSITGNTRSKPFKYINRKISFSVQKKNGFYQLHSEKNIKFPDNSVEDSWLEKYEPAFFVYPEQDIFMRINEQRNGNYIFTFSTLPTYVCYHQPDI